MTDDGSNESDTAHTVALSHSLSLGNHRSESMARYRGHVNHSERIRRIKTHICECGNKLRGTEMQCGKCREGKCT